MFVRFAIALVLGALLGLERELVGEKSARDGSVKMKLVDVVGRSWNPDCASKCLILFKSFLKIYTAGIQRFLFFKN